jgi:predicted nucleotidyltransferase component of viral defense system
VPKLTPTAIRTWADEIGTSHQLKAELDFHLVNILNGIADDATLMERLYLKGGTAINKLYLRDLSRLSIDIDLNQIGSKNAVLSEKDKITSELMKIISSQDDSYTVKIEEKKYEQTTIRVTYPSLVGMSKQHIKVEISHVERFPILPPIKKRLRLPEGEGAKITTYRLEELTATKIRALYDRLKGRDIYDLWSISHMPSIDKTATRKLFLYYFYRGRKVFNPKLFSGRLEKSVRENMIGDDVSGYVRPNVGFGLRDDAREVLNWLGFLNQLDEADRDFILLARILLGKGAIPKEKRSEVNAITYPLIHLFGGKQEITEEARQSKVSDIKLFSENN